MTSKTNPSVLRVRHLSLIAIAVAAVSIQLHQINATTAQATLQSLNDQADIKSDKIKMAIRDFKNDATHLIGLLSTARKDLDIIAYKNPGVMEHIDLKVGQGMANAGLISYSAFKLVHELIDSESLPGTFDTFGDMVEDAISRAETLTSTIDLGIDDPSFLTASAGLNNAWTKFHEQLTALIVIHNQADLLHSGETLLIGDKTTGKGVDTGIKTGATTVDKTIAAT